MLDVRNSYRNTSREKYIEKIDLGVVSDHRFCRRVAYSMSEPGGFFYFQKYSQNSIALLSC
jgi:hypothetical protein